MYSQVDFHSNYNCYFLINKRQKRRLESQPVWLCSGRLFIWQSIKISFPIAFGTRKSDIDECNAPKRCPVWQFDPKWIAFSFGDKNFRIKALFSARYQFCASISLDGYFCGSFSWDGRPIWESSFVPTKVRRGEQ